MKLRLVRGLFECLGEWNYFNSEGKSACAEDVDDPPVFDFNILVFLIKLLEDSGELPGADPGLVLAVSAGAGDLPAAPDGGGGVRMAAINVSLDQCVFNKSIINYRSFMVTIPFSLRYSTLEPFKAISFKLR